MELNLVICYLKDALLLYSRAMLEATSSPVVFCHNDCQEGKLLIFQYCSVMHCWAFPDYLFALWEVAPLWRYCPGAAACALWCATIPKQSMGFCNFSGFFRELWCHGWLSQECTHALLVQVSWWCGALRVSCVDHTLLCCNVHDQSRVYLSHFKRKKCNEWWKWQVG